MKIFKQSPSPELRPFIDRLWGWEGDSSENVLLPTLLPGTGAELYFHYGEMFRFSLAEGQAIRAGHGHLFCVRTTPIELLPASGIGFIAVRFRIGMLQRFTSIRACELEDGQRDVDDIWGGLGAQLLRQLSYATGHQERVALIQSFLIGQLNPESSDLIVEKAMGMLYRQRSSSLSIDGLAGILHLGRRQLERRFKVFSGKSPVEIRSLIRFQHTIRSLLLSPLLGVADAAVSGGYYDQAHFIHDFQEPRRRFASSPLACCARQDAFLQYPARAGRYPSDPESNFLRGCVVFVLLVELEANQGSSEELEILLRSLVELAKHERGVVLYAVQRPQEESDRFVLYECYEDKAAWEDHLKYEPVHERLKSFDYLLKVAPKLTFCNVVSATFVQDRIDASRKASGHLQM